MRKLVVLASLVLVLALAVPAMAQEETPKVDISAGYTYLRINVKATPAGGTQVSHGFNVNGGSGSIAFNVSRSLGFVADLGGSTTTQTITIGGTKFTGSATLFTYMFGPRLSSRGKTWTPFAQALFGGARGSASSGGASGSKNVFAFTVGGGLDANVSQHVAVRLVQAEYFFTNFTSPASSGLTINHQNNFRYTAGIVFRWGGK